MERVSAGVRGNTFASKWYDDYAKNAGPAIDERLITVPDIVTKFELTPHNPTIRTVGECSGTIVRNGEVVLSSLSGE